MARGSAGVWSCIIHLTGFKYYRRVTGGIGDHFDLYLGGIELFFSMHQAHRGGKDAFCDHAP